jgi:uncharacterized UPF0160 family protein
MHVVDVGGVYEPALGRFDHHQRGFALVRDDEHSTPYAAAGLVWKLHGPWITRQCRKVDADLIAPIDRWDVGDRDCGTMMPLSVAVGLLNATDVFDEAAQMAAFEQAVEFCAAILDGKIRQEEEKARLELVYQQARLEAVGERATVAVLPEFIPNAVNRLASDVPSVRFVIFPAGGEWRVQGTPGNKIREEWRGLDRDTLEATSGIEGAVFVHPAGFIGGATTLDGVMAMAAASGV